MSEWARNLTTWQRVRRRLSLSFGSAYEHPDGRIELDFEEPARIGPDDSEEVQRTKLDAYERRKHEGNVGSSRLIGALILGFVAYSVVKHLGMSPRDSLGLGAMAAFGCALLCRR